MILQIQFTDYVSVAGILQMLLRCPSSLIAEFMPEIVQTIDWLVTCQDRVGNWPTRAPDLNETTSGEHELVQCVS
jgi:hypothetical protein